MDRGLVVMRAKEDKMSKTRAGRLDDGRYALKGLHTYRFADNPEERRFAEAWDKEVNRETGVRHGLLAYLLGDGLLPTDVTAREEIVAATVIQWLGSPVGQGFLRNLGYEKNNDVRMQEDEDGGF
jgi:hypothetical protein